MAVLRARALAVAAGVPALFVLMAAGLTFGSETPSATAAETVAAPRVVTSGVARQAAGYRPMDRIYTVATTDPVAFITIDDGIVKDRKGLAYAEANELPITAFLSTWTIKDEADYFTRLTRWGSIQNHSATHASLAKADTDLDHELCYSQRAFAKAFGAQPWLVRPPYGAGGDRLRTQITAQACGLEQIVMWDAVVERGKVSVSGGSLKPGSVVLLHFGDSLAKDLKAAVKAIRAAGLSPANLADYLPDRSTG